MRNSKNAPVIAFANQKGGVGKSALTTLVANNFYFQKEISVAIIDADFPQHTIYKRRLENGDDIKSKPRMLEWSQKEYKKRPPIQIFPIKLDAVIQTIEALRLRFDVIFLDIAGTLNLAGIQKALLYVDYFFIPVLQDFDSYKSSIDFFEVATKSIFPKSSIFKSCHFLLNNLPHNNLEQEFRLKIESIGGTMLQHSMFHHVVYERKFRSTLLPIPSSFENKTYHNEIVKLEFFAGEIYSICFEESSNKSNPTATINAEQKTAIPSAS